MHCDPENFGVTLQKRIASVAAYIQRFDLAHVLNILECGSDRFHTFCQTLNGEDGGCVEGMPKRSILRSPFVSRGIGCASREAGADTALRSAFC